MASSLFSIRKTIKKLLMCFSVLPYTPRRPFPRHLRSTGSSPGRIYYAYPPPPPPTPAPPPAPPFSPRSPIVCTLALAIRSRKVASNAVGEGPRSKVTSTFRALSETFPCIRDLRYRRWHCGGGIAVVVMVAMVMVVTVTPSSRTWEN